MLRITKADRPCQYPQPKIFLDAYERPMSWRDTLKCDVQQARWADWTASLEPADRIFHKMPDGLEDAWCAVLDWYRWDYLTIVHRSDAPEPRMGAYLRLTPDLRERVPDEAHALWSRWARWKGRPWHVIRHARDMAFGCHEIDFYRRRAGKPVVYTAPDYSAEFLEAAWARPKRRRRR